MKSTHSALRWFLLLLCVLPGTLASAADTTAPQTPPGYTNTPFLPSGKWRVHDAYRPRPPVIHPAGLQLPVTPPSDAVLLFDGKDLSQWEADSTNPVVWKVENGYAEVGGKGGLKSKEKFGDCQIHVEWAAPAEVKGTSQGRANSGVFIMGLYEMQVLDSYNNETYADGQAGSVYGQTPPMVNASRPPGEWQSYDIIFEAPRFTVDGKVEKPAYVTVIHNGVCVQNHTEIQGPTIHQKLAVYVPHDPTLPLQLQNHGRPVRYRNIWVRALKDYEAP